MTGLILWVGGALGGQQGIVIAFLFAAATNMVGYWFSDRSC
jgi:heat shock protein HtpX